MKEKLKWMIAGSCLMSLSLGHAADGIPTMKGATGDVSDPFDHNVIFDSSRLLQTNSVSSLVPHLVFKGSSAKIGTNKPIANGFFLYKLQPTEPRLSLPSNPLLKDNTQRSTSTIYGHLFQRLMQHIFVDLSGGYGPRNNPLAQFALNPELKDSNTNVYNKNWFASASALFTHTWKEFAFNANLGLTHAEANSDPMNLYYAQTTTPDLSLSLQNQNKVSFLHENAELSYHANSLFQPFLGAGLLQVVNPNISSQQSLLNLSLPASLDPSLDSNGYKLGGGLSLNYKQYVLRLEQQYFQRGNLYHNNQSTLSFKVNLG